MNKTPPTGCVNENLTPVVMSVLVRLMIDDTVEFRVIDGSPNHFDVARAALRAVEKLLGQMDAMSRSALPHPKKGNPSHVR